MAAETTTLIPARMDRLSLTRYHQFIFWLSALGIFFGVTDLFFIQSTAYVIGSTFSLNTFEIGIAIGISTVGGIFGGFIAGVIGDRSGRKRVFMWTLALYGVGSIITGLSPNFATFIAARIIVGAGVGGELPTVLAMVSEFMPLRVRGAFLALTNGMYAAAAFFASYLALLIVPAYGWRDLFFIMAVPAFVILAIRQKLPESPRWLELKGRQREADEIVRGLEARQGKPLVAVDSNLAVPIRESKAPIRDVFSERLLKRTAVVTIVWWITSFFGLAMISFLVTIMIVKQGYTLTTALGFLTIASTGGIPGFLLAMYLVEKVGRIPTMIGTYVGLGLSTIAIGATFGNLSLLYVTGWFFLFFLGVNFSSILAYTPELYPTRERSSANGWASFIYNLAQFSGATFIGAVLPFVTSFQLMLAFGLVLIAASAAPLWLRLETKGRRLEEISQ